MKKVELTRELLVGAVEDLNKVLDLKPKIVAAFESSLKGAALKAVERKFMDQIEKDLIEASSLIAATDTLEPKTVDVLEALGIKDIRMKLASGGTPLPSVPSSKIKGGKKEEGKVVTKPVKGVKTKVSKPAKEKKDANVEKDKYGFGKGSKASKSVEMIASGKHTMADVKKALGQTCYNALKKVADAGFKVQKMDDGKFKIT